MYIKIEDFQRKISKKIPHRVTGSFSSAKNNSMIMWESQLERDMCYLLEHNDEVTKYESQSKRIYYHDNGKLRRYTPDFYVVYKDGHTEFIEVKPCIFVEKFKNNRAVLLDALIHKNIILKIVTDIHIRCGYFLENIKLVEKYSWTHIPLESIKIINSFSGKYITINELSRLLPKEEIFCLIYKDYFDIDLNNQLITENSLLGVFNDQNYP